MLTHQTARFRGNIIVAIHDHQNQFWLTAEDVGRCLGYGQGNERQGITRVYNRHIDEFLPEDSVVVKLTTTDGKSYDTRVFSKTGCIKLGFFAGTKTAKEFRTWAARTLAGGSAEQAQLAALQAAYLASTPDLKKLLHYAALGLNQAEIGRLLGLAPSNVRERLKKLAAVGLADYRPDARYRNRRALAGQQSLALEG